MAAQESVIILGKKQGQGNGDLPVDLKELVRTRLLIFAGSGYGKSWLIRRLLEQTYNKIHQIVLDREGDFYTMRKLYPYLLASANREVKPDIILSVDMAERLARTTMEMRASIIVDLSSLEPDARVEFVDRFVKTLLNLPKSLRHHALVVIDEVQEFCDQDERIASTKTLKLFAEQARKRGLCPVYATQRIADVNKTAISQLHNRLIGGASLDIDVARATLAAGFAANRRTEIEELQTGEFFARGPAISKKAVKVKIGPVETPHPEVGVEIEPPVPVTDEKMQRALEALRSKQTQAEAVEEEKESESIEHWRMGKEMVGFGKKVFSQDIQKLIENLEEQVKLKQATIDATNADRLSQLRDLEKKDTEIEDLKVNLQDALDANSRAEAFKNALSRFLRLEDLDTLRAEHDVMMGEGSDATRALKLEGEQAQVTIEKKVVTKPTFKTGSAEWMLIDIITDGWFHKMSTIGKKPGVKEIYVEMLERYPVDKNYPRFYKNQLWPAMGLLSKYPYNYIAKEGNTWYVTEQGEKYLAKKVVAT